MHHTTDFSGVFYCQRLTVTEIICFCSLRIEHIIIQASPTQTLLHCPPALHATFITFSLEYELCHFMPIYENSKSLWWSNCVTKQIYRYLFLDCHYRQSKHEEKTMKVIYGMFMKEIDRWVKTEVMANSECSVEIEKEGPETQSDR